MISMLRKIIFGFSRGILFSIILSSLTILSSIGLMGASAYLIVNAGFHPSIAFLQVSIVAVRFFGISRAVFRYLERLISHNINLKILARIRETVFKNLQENYPNYSNEYSSPSILSLLTHDIDLLENLFVRFLLPIASAILVCVCMGLFIGVRSVEILEVMLFGFALVGILLPALSAIVGGNSSRIVQLNRAEYQKTITEFLLTFQESILYHQAKILFNVQRSQEIKLAKSQQQQNISQAIFASFSFLIVQLTALGAVWVGFSTSTGMVTELIMLSIYYLMILAAFESLQNLPAAANLFGGIRHALNRIERTSVQNTLPSTLPSSINSSIFPINFENVSFFYPGSNKASLQHIKLELSQGEKIAIVGQNGSGKSTFLSVLAGILPDYLGMLTLNKVPQHLLKREFTMSRIGFFSSQPYIFTSSLQQNLMIANPGTAKGNIRRVVEQVGLDDRFANKISDQIQEHGRNLSQGEMQRIEIGRMLLRDDELILLDEPLSAIDPLFRNELIPLIKSHSINHTLIWVTHQFIEMDYFDRILVFADGEIIEMGNHEDLLQKRGHYFRMYSEWFKQFENS